MRILWDFVTGYLQSSPSRTEEKSTHYMMSFSAFPETGLNLTTRDIGDIRDHIVYRLLLTIIMYSSRSPCHVQDVYMMCVHLRENEGAMSIWTAWVWRREKFQNDIFNFNYWLFRIKLSKILNSPFVYYYQSFI